MIVIPQYNKGDIINFIKNHKLLSIGIASTVLIVTSYFFIFGSQSDPSESPQEIDITDGSKERLSNLTDTGGGSATGEQKNTKKQPSGTTANNASYPNAKDVSGGGSSPGKPGAPNSIPGNAGTDTDNSTPPKNQSDDDGPLDEGKGKIKTKPKAEVKSDKALVIGGISWRILSSTTASQITAGNETDKAQGKYVILQLEAKLAEGVDKNTKIDTEWIFLVDSTWTYFNNDIAAEGLMQMQGKDSLSYEELAPRKTVKGYIVYDIPKDAKDLKLAIFDMNILSYDFGTIDIKI